MREDGWVCIEAFLVLRIPFGTISSYLCSLCISIDRADQQNLHGRLKDYACGLHRALLSTHRHTHSPRKQKASTWI